MKLMKRVLSLLLCAVMLVSYVPATAFAAEEEANVVLGLEKTQVNVGDTIKVTLSHTDMTVASFTCGLEFDKDLLECVSISGPYAEYGTDYEALYFLTKANVPPMLSPQVYASAVSSTTEANGNGHVGFAVTATADAQYVGQLIYTVTFKAKATGAATITAYEDSDGTDGYNGDADTAVVTILEAAPATFALYGDVQADGLSEGEDLTAILAAYEEKTGYTFKGWSFYKDAAKTQAVTLDGNKMPAHDLYVFGNWEKIPSTITFMDGDKNVGEATANAEGKATIIANPTSTDKHKTFKGWATYNGGTVDTRYVAGAEIALEKDITLYAVWNTTTCADDNKDHKCDTCSTVLTYCKDSLKATAAKPATCIADGNKAYWTCTVCGEYYLSADATQRCDEGAWIEQATNEHSDSTLDQDHICDTEGCNVKMSDCADADKNHYCDECGFPLDCKDYVVHKEGVAPRCHYAGLKEHWYCENCDVYYLDAECEDITSAKNLPIPALKTTADHAPAKAATCTAGGNLEYWFCEECDQVWADEALTELSSLDKMQIDALGHSYGELINAAKEIHTEYVLKGAVAAHYFCDVCDTYFTDAKVETTLEELTGETPVHTHDKYQNTKDNKHQSICSCGLVIDETEHDFTYDKVNHKCICGTVESFKLRLDPYSNGVKLVSVNGQSVGAAAKYVEIFYGQALEIILKNTVSQREDVFVYNYRVASKYTDLYQNTTTITIPADEVTGHVYIEADALVNVTVDLNGGVCSDESGFTATDVPGVVKMADVLALDGTQLRMDNYVEREGYNLVKLVADNGTEYQANKPLKLSGDMALTAQWECLHAKTTFVDNGEGGHMLACANPDCNTQLGEAEPHIGGEDDGDCTTAVECTVCDAVTTPAKDHAWEHVEAAGTTMLVSVTVSCDADGCTFSYKGANYDETDAAKAEHTSKTGHNTWGPTAEQNAIYPSDYDECSQCDAAEWSVDAENDGNHTCDICGEYELTSCDADTYQNDGETHTVIHNCSSEPTHNTSESGKPHVYDEDTHTCDCGAKEQVTYTVNIYYEGTDGQYSTTPDKTETYTADYGTQVDYSDKLDMHEKSGFMFSDASTVTGTAANDLVLTVKYVRIQTPMTFYDADGVSYKEIYIRYGETVKLPDAPAEIPGMTFRGWECNGEIYAAGTEVTGSASITGSMDYYAVYDVNSYTVTWMVDGEEYTKTTVKHGESITAPESNPIKEGYRFDGWEGYTAGMTAAEDLTFEAKLSKYVTVTYYKYDIDKLDYVAETLDNDFVVGDTITLPDSNYAIWGGLCNSYGWDVNDDGNADYEYSAQYTLTGDVTFKPVLIPFYADVDLGAADAKFVDENGNDITRISADGPYLNHTTMTNLPTREGYRFKGWDMDGDVFAVSVNEETGVREVTLSFSGNTVVTAVWEKTYTATFLVNDELYTTLQFAEGETIVKPAYTAPEGYYIGYPWITPSTMPAWDLTFNAEQRARTYNITYNLDGGAASNPGTYNIESDTITLAEPTKAGCTFAGWTWEGQTEPVKTVTIPTGSTGSRSYTANWKANSITLTIDLGSHGTMAGTGRYTYTADYGSEVKLPEIVVAEGYQLVGWTANFGGEDQAATALPTEMPAASGTYTAQWELIDVAVTFQDGDNTETVSGKYFDADKTAPTPAAKEGHTFLGWYEHAGENAKKVFDAGQTINLNSAVKDKTYYAKWEANTYNIHWNLNDGKVIDGWELISTAKYGEQISVMLVVEKTGWVLNTTNGVTAEGVDGSYFYTTPYCLYSFTMPANDITLTLNWDVWYVGIEWLVEGESTMDTVAYGNVPVYPNGIPTKASDEQYTYTFAGWSPEVVPATGPAEYTATFTPVLRSYDITFVVDGTETKVPTKYGETPVFEGTPTKATDEKYSYTFAGWDTDLVPVTGEATYTATWTQTPVEHTVTFLVEGQIWKQYAGGYGTAVDYSDLETPSKTGHSFAWDQAEAEWPATIPAEDVTITGTYTSKQYTITFMGEIGWDDDNDPETHEEFKFEITADYDSDLTEKLEELKEAIPKLAGYEIVHWCIGVDPEAESPYENAEVYDLPETMGAEDVTVYALWTYTNYELTIQSSIDSETIATSTFIIHDMYENLDEFHDRHEIDIAALTPDGYEFTGYTYNGAAWDPEIGMPAENVTLVAVFEPIDYTITFMNGDTKVGEITAAYGSDITEAVAAISVTAPEGHSLNCWMNDSGKCVTLDTMPLNGMTVYADFTVAEFNINFFATEGDETAFETFKVPFGTKLDATTDDPATDEDETDAGKLAELLAQVEDPAKEGHTWKGWDTENVPATMPAKTVNIYGKWDVNSYTVTADGEDYTFAYGATVTIPEPTKEGHTFGGWNETVPTTMPAHDVVLTAKWTVNTYSITFDVEGIETITANFGEAVTKPADPELAGHTFQGWSEDGKTVIDFPETMPENGLNLKAVWVRNTIFITFNVEGNEKTVEFKYGDTITVPEDLNLEKAADNKWTYKFTGWDPALPETAEVGATYTAQFAEDQKITYNVKFQDPENAEYSYTTVLAWDAVIDLTTLAGFTAPEKAHNTLTWTVDGAAVEFPYTMEAKDVTFVAKWTPETYTITIDGAEPVSYAYGADLKIPAPTKEGHEFKGWLKNGEAYEIPATMPAENLVLTSDWKVNSYKLTFKYASAENQEETVVFEAVDYGTALADKIPTVPSWTDAAGLLYEFKSWSAEIPATMPATDLEVSATFTKTGWVTDERGTTYLVKDALLAYAAWETIQEAEYWFDFEGYIVKDITLIGSDYCAFDHETGKFLSDYTGIYEALNGDLYYVENGVAVENMGLVRTFLDGGHIHYYYFGCGANGCTCNGKALYIAQKNVRHWAEHTNGYLMKGSYDFGEDGVIAHTDNTNLNGIQKVNGVKFYLMDGVKVPYGLALVRGDYYYARSSGALVVNQTYWVSANKLNGVERNGEPMKAGNYTFDEEGRIVFEVAGNKNGVYQENGKLYFYKDGVKNYAGLIQWTGDLHDADGNVVKAGVYNNSWIYANTSGEVKSDCKYWISKTNGHMIAMSYTFDVYGIMEDGYTAEPEAEKNGVYEENGKLYYYVNNVRNYAGLMQYTGDLNKADGTVIKGAYNNSWIYANTSGEVKSNCSYWISKNNGYMKNGNYTFDEIGVMTNPKPIA